MIVYTKCKSCKKELNFRTSSPSRMEYSKEYDDYKTLSCDCGHSYKFHVDELRAKESGLNALVVSVFCIALIFVVGYLAFFSADNYFIVGGFLLIPLLVYGVLKKQEQSNISNWNRKKIKSNR